LPVESRPGQPRVELVLHVAAEDTVFDQDRVLGHGPFVVHVQGAAPTRQGAVVHDRHARRGDPLADPTGECRAALAVEVALESMADRLVQQHTRPAGTEHHRHGSGRGIAGIEIGHGQTNRLARKGQRPILDEEIVQDRRERRPRSSPARGARPLRRRR
jgi:hypothetical protein